MSSPVGKGLDQQSEIRIISIFSNIFFSSFPVKIRPVYRFIDKFSVEVQNFKSWMFQQNP